MQLDKLYTENPPEHLFHYTSLGGMLGIIQSGAIWATEVRYLNDTEEMANAYNVAIIELRQMAASSNEFSRKSIKALENWLAHRTQSGHQVFVTSLTKDGNLLSQWRGYTPANSGVSLGFDTDTLLELAQSQGFQLGRCVYELEDQRSIVRQLLTEVLSSCKNVEISKRKNSDVTPGPLRKVFERFEERILLTFILLKQRAFKEENEWRLVSPVISNYAEAPIDFRVGGTCLVPYIKFNLISATDRKIACIHRAYVGPTPHMAQSMNTINMALTKYLEGGRIIINSQVPLRQV